MCDVIVRNEKNHNVKVRERTEPNFIRTNNNAASIFYKGASLESSEIKALKVWF